MTWLVAAASLVATVANIHRLRWCFVVWAATNSAWAFYDFTHGLPAQGCLMCIYACLAAWGFHWKRQDEKGPFGRLKRDHPLPPERGVLPGGYRDGVTTGFDPTPQEDPRGDQSVPMG